MEQLRQFVEPQSAQEFADPGVAITIAIGLPVAIKRRVESSEFVQQKAFAVAANALLPKHDRRAEAEQDQDRDNQE